MAGLNQIFELAFAQLTVFMSEVTLLRCCNVGYIAEQSGYLYIERVEFAIFKIGEVKFVILID
jgi:hypothetical protein